MWKVILTIIAVSSTGAVSTSTTSLETAYEDTCRRLEKRLNGSDRIVIQTTSNGVPVAVSSKAFCEFDGQFIGRESQPPLPYYGAGR